MATISEIPKLETVEYVNVEDLARQRKPNHTTHTPDPPKVTFDSVSRSSESFTQKYCEEIRIARIVILNVLIVAYFIWATVYFFHQRSISSKSEKSFHSSENISSIT